MSISRDVIPEELTSNMLDKRAKRWRHEIPKAFKEFMTDNNGGVPRKKVAIEQWVIERFLCIVDSVSTCKYGEYDIEVIASKYDSFMSFSEDSIGLDLVPFAMLNHDSYLCLCNKTKEPSVVVWQLKGSTAFKPNTVEVFDTFQSFLIYLDTIFCTSRDDQQNPKK